MLRNSSVKKAISFRKRSFGSLGAFLLCLIILALPAAAFAIDLDAAKQQGLVGETPSGYIESVRPNPSGEIQSLVQKINSARKQEYQRIAQKNGTALSAVEQIGGKKAIRMTPNGQYVKRPEGSWVKK